MVADRDRKPRSARAAAELLCATCGHAWKTTAADGATVRCPACTKPKRVPSGVVRADAVPAPAPVRTPIDHVRTQPERVQTSAKSDRAAAGSVPIEKQPIRVERPAAPSPNVARRRELSSIIPGFWAAVIAAAPSRELFDRVHETGSESRLPSPDPIPAGSAVDPAAVDRALASIGLTRDPDWPVRSCPIAACGSPATVRVVWGPTAALNICANHRDRITAAYARMQRHIPEFRAITARP